MCVTQAVISIVHLLSFLHHYLKLDSVDLDDFIMPPPPSKKAEYIALRISVGRYPIPCATDNSRTLNLPHKLQ